MNNNQHIFDQILSMSQGGFEFPRTGENPPEDVIKKANASQHFFFKNLLISKMQIEAFLVSIPKELLDVIAVQFLIEHPDAKPQNELIAEVLNNVHI